MKVSQLLQSPSVRVLIFIGSKNRVRHADLLKVIKSRGTLSDVLNELENEGLIERKIITSKPIQSFYHLTAKGEEVANHLRKIGEALR